MYQSLKKTEGFLYGVGRPLSGDAMLKSHDLSCQAIDRMFIQYSFFVAYTYNYLFGIKQKGINQKYERGIFIQTKLHASRPVGVSIDQNT